MLIFVNALYTFPLLLLLLWAIRLYLIFNKVGLFTIFLGKSPVFLFIFIYIFLVYAIPCCTKVVTCSRPLLFKTMRVLGWRPGEQHSHWPCPEQRRRVGRHAGQGRSWSSGRVQEQVPPGHQGRGGGEDCRAWTRVSCRVPPGHVSVVESTSHTGTISYNEPL